MHFNYYISDNLKLLLGSTYKSINEKVNLVNETYKSSVAYDYKYSELDLYSKLQYKVNDKIELNAGIRHSKKNDFKIEYDVINLSTNSKINKTPVDIEARVNYLPEFSAIYHINSSNHIKFLHGKANQLAYNANDIFEDIESTEINYIYLSNKFQINSSIFYNKAKNISLFTQKGTDKATTPNGNRITKGIEFYLAYKVNYNFDINTSFTIQDTKNEVIENSKITNLIFLQN